MASYEEAEDWIEAQDWDFEAYETFEDFIDDVKSRFTNGEGLIDTLVNRSDETPNSQSNLEIFYEDNKQTLE